MKENNVTEELVTIIVPVYNVEKYIEQCLNSLITQTYKNLEIIVVNDGSPDNSETIIKELMKTDDRIKLISQKNAGVSMARNNAINNATGEYIIFVDADDYLAKDYVEYMLELINQDDCQFACTIKNYWANGEKQTQKIVNSVYSSEETVGLLLSPDVMVGCTNKIYRRSFLSANNLLFRSDLYYGEGLNYIIRAAIAATKVGIGNKKVYYYRKNNLSSATTKYSFDKYSNGEKSLQMIGKMINRDNDYVQAMYELHLSTFYLGALTKLIENGKVNEHKEKFAEWKKYIRNSLTLLLRSKYVSVYRKTMLLVGSVCPNIIVWLNKKREKNIIKNSVK
ncbi:MAG: glycosyltransferase family 2 protein [Clostridia bacterium]|nr:glycosyltransferase family 2 protein [Clostridia bacterium]